MIVVDGRHAGYSASAFSDSLHLNRQGAARLSVDLADIINRPSDDESRWVALPSFESVEPAITDAVEHLELSRIALRVETGKRRK